MGSLRWALRSLRKSPGVTASAMVTLALGIGANTALFSVVNSVLFKPLDYPQPESLVRVVAVNQESGIRMAGLAPGDFLDFQRESGTLDGLSAFTSASVAWTGGSRPMVLRATRVSPSIFGVLGAGPRAGRVFSLDESDPGRDRVAVVSDRFWKTHLGGVPWRKGETLRLDGESYAIVGVMAEDFRFPAPSTDLWLPLAFSDQPSRRSHYLGVVARVAPGASVEQAGEDLKGLSARLQERHAETNQGWEAHVVPWRELLVGEIRPTLLALFGAVGFVLLIACANVANLLLARSASRRREAAVRAAVGASKLQLVRTFLTESLLLALAGGAAGLVLAVVSIRVLLSADPAGLPRHSEIGVDYQALLFALGVSVVTGVVFGAVPALRYSRFQIDPILREGVVSGKGAGGGTAARSAMIVVQLAIALVLMIGAGLMFKGFYALGRVDPGFHPQGVLALQIELPYAKYVGDEAVAGFYDALIERLRPLPGVRSVGASSSIPLSTFGQNVLPFSIRSNRVAASTQGEFAGFSIATPGYFQSMGIPMRTGRDFSKSDRTGRPVAIINEAMARRYWKGEDPIGDAVALTVYGDQPIDYEIVGVVGTTRRVSLQEDPDVSVYVPFHRIPLHGMSVVVRTDNDALALAEAVQQRIVSIDPEQPVQRVLTLEDLVSGSMSQARFYTGLLLSFALIGVVVASVGVYGLTSFITAQRAQEVAVRMVFGATPRRVLSGVLRQGLKRIAAGLAVGLLAAAAVTRFLSSILYKVSPQDPPVFIGVAFLLGLVAVAAVYIPARRTAHRDPLVTLRGE